MLRKAIVLAVVVAAPALADIVVKKDGTKLRGVIVEETSGRVCPACDGAGMSRERGVCPNCNGRGRTEGELTIKLPGGVTVTLKESEIEAVVREPGPAPEELLPPREAYGARSAKLHPDDAEGHYDLAKWCVSKGLRDEAEKHLSLASQLDPSSADRFERLRRVIEHKRDARAKRAAREALKLAESGSFEKAASSIAKVLAEHAKSPFVRSPEAQAAYIKREFPAVHEFLGSNLSDIASAAREKARFGCKACRGRSWTRCASCRGTGEGPCPKCERKGWMWCLDCNGTGKRICPRCLGTGEVSQGEPLTMNLSSVCPRCRGKRTVICGSCRGKGKLVCPLCRGKGAVPGGCKDCGGTAKRACVACLGTGLKKVTTFRWGPVPRRPEKGPIVVPDEATSRRVWQGSYRGCLVTVFPSEFLHNGALRVQLNKRLEVNCRYLLVCIDNREGTRQIVFSPAEKTVRFVTADARQIEMLDLAARVGSLELDEVYRKLAPQFGEMAILPGVVSNAVVPIVTSIDLSKVATAFWGKEKPWALKDYFLTRAQVDALRRTLRE